MTMISFFKAWISSKFSDRFHIITHFGCQGVSNIFSKKIGRCNSSVISNIFVISKIFELEFQNNCRVLRFYEVKIFTKIFRKLKNSLLILVSIYISAQNVLRTQLFTNTSIFPMHSHIQFSNFHQVKVLFIRENKMSIKCD